MVTGISWKRLYNKFRSMDMAKLLSALRPKQIDELLYEAECSIATATGAHSEISVRELDIERFDYRARSGNDAIDRLLQPGRCCYVAKRNGQLAHWSWTFDDVALPGQFGFNTQLPVIGNCFTTESFRGLHIYSRVLAHIRSDIRSQHLAAKVYVLVSPDNIASIKGIERAGFRCLARLSGLRVLGFIINRSVRIHN